jgi:hypothetical protein
MTTLLAGLVGLAFASSALAQDRITIYVAGANGDRATTNTAIAHLLTGASFVGTSTDYTKANFGIFRGGTYGGIPIDVKTAYIGATGGIAAVAGSLPVRFLPDSAAVGANNPDPTVGTNPNDPQVPDIAMSTNFISSSPFVNDYQGHFYEDLTQQDNILSVIGLKWVASKGFPANAANITPQIAQLLYQNGRVPLALFTGDPADQNKTVFATGRNLDAGQRYAAQAETGIGINAVVKQYKPTISGAAAGVGGFITGGNVTSHVLWPVETFSNVSSQFPGNSGATTGANLAPLLTATLDPAAYKVGNPNATAGYYISYLTPQDADTIAIPNGAVELKYNGVPYSDENIRQGKYTFWVYEHLFYRSSIKDTQARFADALVGQIKNVDAAVAGIFLNTVKVSRKFEGGLVTPSYF